MVNPDEDILQQFAQEEPSESPLTLLAGNTTTANDATGGGLNAYRASGASVQPAKSAAEIYNQLHPEAATRIQRFFELADERGLGLKPGSMNRDYGTQAKMYADKQAGLRGAYQNLPVSPPGSSTHMGFATDFSGYKPEKLEAIRELAKEVGLVYGGNWSGKTFDPVHIQLGPGSDVTRYIQQHINPQAGSVNWEGVRSTQLPEDFLKRAIAAAQGQNVDAIYVPTREARVEGMPNATGSATVEPDVVKEADAKVEVTKKRKDIDFAKLIKMLDDSTHGGADYLSRSMQANAQQAQANRSRSLAQIAQFDQEQINKMAEALKGGRTQSFKEGGEVHGYNDGGPKLPDRPEYGMTDSSDAVDMTPTGPWERTFARVTGGRNLQNDLSNIQSRLPTMEDYGNALLHQRDVAQETSELGRHNLREGYTNRDLPQMLLGTGQGILGVVSPAMTPVNAGLDVLVNTAGKFDPRAKVEAELLGLVGTEGAGVTQKLHNLELPKSSWDALLKKYQDSGATQAMTIGLPAAVAAAERPVEAATRSLSPVGLYSHAAEMAEALPQAKGTPEQMRAMLFDKYGVKPAELEGFEEKFFGRPSVTKEELAQHFRERMPQVEEKVLGARPSLTPKEQLEWENLSKRFEEKDMTLKMEDAERMSELDMKKQRLPDSSNPARFEKWSLPGGENYREVLLKLPMERNLPEGFKVVENPIKASTSKEYIVVDETGWRYGSGNTETEAIDNYSKNHSPNKFVLSHWKDDPNVLAHLRMSDRTGPKGEKLLHVEEMQSDWGQKGRKEGFDTPETRAKMLKELPEGYVVENAPSQGTGFPDRYFVRNEQGQLVGTGYTRESAINSTINELNDQVRGTTASLVPSAPYVTSTQGWTDLALKRVLKEAAEGGYDGIVFTPGAEQAKRYDLSKSISNVGYDPNSKTLQAVDHNRNVVLFERNVEPNKLPDFLGKEVAEKLMNEKNIVPYSDGTGILVHELSGQDLSIGGEGMKGYYDKIVPTQLQKLVKGYDKDAKLGTMEIPDSASMKGVSGYDVMNWLPETNHMNDAQKERYWASLENDERNQLFKRYFEKNKNITGLHLPVTDKMREHILKGQKAYMRGGRVGYADGGLVTDNGQTPDGTGRQHYDAYGNVSDAQGGPVRAVAYDQNLVNTLAQQLNEGTYG